MASAKGRFESWSDSSDVAASSPIMSGRVASVCASFTKTTPSFDVGETCSGVPFERPTCPD